MNAAGKASKVEKMDSIQHHSNKKTKQVLFLFIAITLILSWAYEALLILTDGVKKFGLLGLIVLMWIPGFVSILLRVLFKVGFSDIGFVCAKSKFYAWAVGVPLFLALVTNAVSVPLGMKTLGLVPFDILFEKIGPIILSLVIGVFGAFGEELGWRGFLLPKLVKAKVRNPLLVSGVIWALWHAPIVSLGGYYNIDSPMLIAFVYSFTIVTSGYVVGLLRIRSHSVWVATIFHASHNFFFQLVVPHLVFSGKGPNYKYWELIGADCGIIVGVLYLLAAFYMLRTKHPAQV